MKTGFYVAAFLTALLFGVGLVVGGMTMPTKVIGFLDFAGNWDPSLMWVMGGAAGTYAVGFRLITKKKESVFAGAFQIPKLKDITPRLVIGSAIFGIGWGLGGFCPGPALTSLGSAYAPVIAFVIAMFVGMFVFKLFDQWSTARAAANKPKDAPLSNPTAQASR